MSLNVYVEQRIIIKFLSEKEVNPAEISGRLGAEFWENTVPKTLVFA